VGYDALSGRGRGLGLPYRPTDRIAVDKPFVAWLQNSSRISSVIVDVETDLLKAWPTCPPLQTQGTQKRLAAVQLLWQEKLVARSGQWGHMAEHAGGLVSNCDIRQNYCSKSTGAQPLLQP
jgi:hypothetical protein